jgi:NNMT/PNMT/TEMT family
VPQTDPFESFPARAYLEYYYSYVGSENEAMMRTLANFAAQFEPCFEHVVEVAGGPSVVPILSLCAATGRSPSSVTFTDISSKNMEEAQLWLHDRPGAFEYTKVLRWLSNEHALEPGRIEQLARASEWTLPVIDLRKPLPANMVNAFDTVSSHFFAESATNDRDTLVTLLSGIARLGKPEARVFLSFMRRSVGYTVAGMDFPAVPVDEDTLPGILEVADFHLGEMECYAIDTEDPPTRDGYEGMVFVGGILRPQRQASRSRQPARAAVGT